MAALGQVVVLFLLIVVGYTIKKLNLITNNINRDLSNLVLNVALPAFIITAMNFSFSPHVLIESGKLLIISLCIYIFTIASSFVIPKLFNIKNKVKDIFQYIIVFSNVGFMGYPVTKAIFGDIGVFYAAIYNLPFNILLWTFGVYIMTRKHGEGKQENKVNFKAFVNPGIIAVIIGFVLFLFSLELPGPILTTLNMLGGLTTPLAMLFIGSILAEVEAKEIFTDFKVFILSGIRLLILPILVFFVLNLMGFSGYLIGIPVLITAMPAAANAAIMASKFDNDYQLASKAVFLSTLFSIVTIPLIVMIVQ